MDQRIRRALRYSSWLPRQDDEGAMWLSWLVRLRWVAIAAQIITLSFAFQLIDQPYMVLPILTGVIGTLVLANLYMMRILAANEAVPEGRLLLQLGIDVAALTAFFLLAGGPENTFTSLYLVHVAMGSVMLSTERATILSTLVLTCYCSLFFYHLPLHFERHTLDATSLQQIGAVLSFTITLVSVAGFTLGLSRSLRERKQALLESRDRTARIDRLRSVGTLAAGAAHELNTPLSTIGLRLRRVLRRHTDPDTGADVQVMRDQLKRCTRVVDQLLVGAGDPSAAGIERKPLAKLVDEGVKLWAKGSSLEVQVDDKSRGAVVELPRIAFVQALINLLENAREAQEAIRHSEPLHIAIWTEPQRGMIALRDRGCGLPTEANQVGEPFFTTKKSGTGLGVFVARQVADGAGGGLSYQSAPSGGTIALWWFPLAQRRSG